MKTQREIELEAYGYGKERMAKAIERNEDKGRADSNPYAQAVWRRFVLPLAERVAFDLDQKRPGRRQAHVALLQGVDPEAVAYIAVRAALVNATANKGGRSLVSAVGRSVYHELLLTNFQDINRELFYTLTTDFERKMSHDERHRMTVYRLQAEKAGIPLPVWGVGDRDQVGAYFVERMQEMGMLDVEMRNEVKGGRIKTILDAGLSAEVRALLDQISDYVIESTPYFLPCVEKPKDWTALNEGGFHTEELRRLMPYVVKTSPASIGELRTAELTQELAAVNALQNTAWRINKRILDTVRNVSEHFDMKEVLQQGERPQPKKPEWLGDHMEVEQMTEKQQREFKMWKREMSNWYLEGKEREVKWGRYYNALRVAAQFRDYPELYFVYFMDYRTRKYAQTSGVSPQGSDLQKALLEFSHGKPLHTQDAKDWFCITGANRWGYDKATLPDRVAWVAAHHDNIMSFASDPLSNREWTQADKPLQFLAWCMEYADWQVFGDAFQSRISVGMDGSCNGLQNFSAMLRDEVGGVYTNLLPPENPWDVPNDIYGKVAEVTIALLEAADPDEAGFHTRWLEHGINRTLVKRSVMTLPYGSTRFSCADFIAKDYLRAGKAPEFDKKEYSKAAQYLSKYVWEAIGLVVIKAREAMRWLQKASNQLLKAGAQDIRWTTPTGFPVIQTYWEQSIHQINTLLCGKARLKIQTDTDTVDRNRHKNGVAPNFVHSLDASHLTLTVNAATALGIDAFHMVHDDFGTHAADAQALYTVIREQFLGMYIDTCPMQAFREAHPELPDMPAKGTLDLNLVLESPYFFS